MRAHASLLAGGLRLAFLAVLVIASTGSAAATPGTVPLPGQPQPSVDAARVVTAVAESSADRITSSGAAGDRRGRPAPPATLESPTRAQFATRPPCLPITANPLGSCPVPSRGPQPPGGRPTISLCPSVAGVPVPSLRQPRQSVCGRGFHPNDAVLLVASGPHGSIGWRALADATGSFSSPLPAVLCTMMPLSLFAIDAHGDRSNPLALAGAGCAI